MSLHQVDAAGFDLATQSEGPVLVKIFATWCGPCKLLGPVVEAVAEKNLGIAFLELDIDKSPEIPTKLKLSGVPVLLLYKDGNEVGRLTGFHGEAKVQELINKVVLPNA